MAKQHFYSCVPAKMSLFNKMDGFDTFAMSDGISEDCIFNELSSVYNIKLSKSDLELIQNGKLPPVYFQFQSKEGNCIQSAMSFIPSDYTGERSSYMVHSLILSDNEKKSVYEDDSKAMFNPAMFKNDLSDFDLTSISSAPQIDMAEKKLSLKKICDVSLLAEKYDTGMLKRLIYAFLSISCGKLKAVYFSLPSDINNFSKDCLDFINSFVQIFPYHLRYSFSFVTYLSDITKYNNFKIKCVSESMPMVPLSKGVSIKMGQKDYSGINDQKIGENAAIVDFFYSLIKNDEMRRDFLAFCNECVKNAPELAKTSFKNIEDLVFIYRSLSGNFQSKAVIPNDDAMYSYICIYDKLRKALPLKYRENSMNPLNRYPENKLPIPKNVFTKLCNIYPEEPDISKKNIINIVLELIHTDVMREKLFSFIRSIYENENEETKSLIIESVCRVYYGGFLQKDILGFFSAHFSTVNDSSRANIIEKLLLTIRTPSVQNAIISFFDNNFSDISDSERKQFFDTFYQMLPLGDSLSRQMADIIDKYIKDEEKEEVASKVLSALEMDEKRTSPVLCEELCANCGFIEGTIAKKVFTDWQNRKILATFCEKISKKPLGERIDTIFEIWRNVHPISSKSIETLCESLKSNFTNCAKFDIFELIDSIDRISELGSEIPDASQFCERFANEIAKPFIPILLNSVFDIKKYPDGVDRITELSESRVYIKIFPEFQNISEYNSLISAIDNDDICGVFIHFSKLEAVRRGASALIKKHIEGMQLSDNMQICILAIIDKLENQKFKFSSGIQNLRDKFSAELRAQNQNSKPDAINYLIDEKTFGEVIKLYQFLIKSDIPEEIKNEISDNSADFALFINSFYTKYSKKGKKFASNLLIQLNADEDFKNLVLSIGEESKASGGFLKKLFGKK